jgi:hypothetical protein
MLVSVRTERNHRNGPAIRQVEAAERKPGRRKRQRTATSPAPSLDDNPELPNDHTNDEAGDGGMEEHTDTDMSGDQIVIAEDNLDGLQVRHTLYSNLKIYSQIVITLGISQP